MQEKFLEVEMVTMSNIVTDPKTEETVSYDVDRKRLVLSTATILSVREQDDDKVGSTALLEVGGGMQPFIRIWETFDQVSAMLALAGGDNSPAIVKLAHVA